MVGEHVEDEEVHRMATNTIVENDEDCDGRLNFDEFVKVNHARE